MSVVLQIAYVPSETMLHWLPHEVLDIARQIAAAPGLHWKMWVYDRKDGTCGGICLFETEASARAWEKQAKALFTRFGAIGVTTELLFVDERLSALTRAPTPSCSHVEERAERPAIPPLAPASISNGVRPPFSHLA